MPEKRKSTPEHIARLESNEIFTFGSNTAGRHGRGAARQAYYDFGAEYGVGEGLTGQSYALPTLDDFYLKRTDEELLASLRKFFVCAADTTHLTFLVTKIGCGLAGYTEDHMKSLVFTASCEYELDTGNTVPLNIVWPEGWQ